ncbi:ATP-binding protein [Streptomyces lydicus]
MIADAVLLTRVLTTLGAEALRHSSRDRPPVFTAEVHSGRLEIRVEDGSPATGPDARAPEASAGPRTADSRADSLALRLSRDLVEAMDGTLDTVSGPTCTVTFTLPRSAPGGSTTPGPHR